MTGRELSIRAAGTATPTYRLGGTDVPLITDPRCKVCMSPHRFDAEEQIIVGTAYAKINDRLPEGATFTSDSLRRHYHNHMSIEKSEMVGIVHRRAVRVGKRISDSEESLVDGISLMEVVVQKTFERIALGEITPTLKEGLAAAKALADLGEYDDEAMDQQAYAQAFSVFMDEASKLMGSEMFGAFGVNLERNAVLQALMAKYNPQGKTESQGEPESQEDPPSEDS